MADQRVAARYAKSLLDLGKEMGTLDSVKADMDLLSKAMAESRELRLLLRNPIVKHDKKLAILKAIFGGKVSDMTMRFFTILTEKNREAALESMGTEFQVQYNAMQGIQMAEVTSATPLTAASRAEMEKLVTQQTGLTEVKLTEKVDPSLIGGFILRVGDNQIDDSVRTSLRKLRTSLQENSYQQQL
ncbi:MULTISPECIES: ATP synthase F1 subunit delta [Hymenobacter]|uniref:ATP synthase subunit delta n=1 Tax=Hymenobacter armeniacus TaxID=2771358 RepID=A0ABR8JY44_9BACT|nr:MULTISPECIES: ATP synthase F1 subunit delta [Hymenobacter]MBD2723721.1 ATP synthase F1 subunit delta [Hymenobacter armeniacus]MBJ6107797.1 ATP synthase F1 subunit delta [Hymenobacter sp. BT523]